MERYEEPAAKAGPATHTASSENNALSPHGEVPKRASPPQNEPSFIQRHSLSLAGGLNLVGDIGLLRSGFSPANPNPYRKAAGALYTLGGLNLVSFGHVNKKLQIQDVAERVATLIEKEDGDLYKTAAHHLRQNAQKLTGRVERFFYNNPGQNTMALYTAGAATMFASGLRQLRREKDYWELAYGTSSLTLKLLSFIIPEKSKHEDNKEPSNLLEWIKEKPLRLFGYGSFITDGLFAWGTYKKYMANPKGNHLSSAITSATFLMADALMAISYKDPSNLGVDFSSNEQQQLEKLIAEAIATLPKERQAAIIDSVAEFLSRQPEIPSAMDKDTINQSITSLITALAPQRWVNKINQPESAVLSR